MGTIEERLAAREQEFKQARPPAVPGELPEDGTYQAVVERFDTFESKKGELFLKTEFKIVLDSKYEGTKVEMIHSLDDSERFGWLKKHLWTLGLDPDDFSFGTLLTELQKVLDVPVELAVVTSQKTNPSTGERYRNCFLNKRLGDALPSRSDVPSSFEKQPPVMVPTDDGEDLPF